MERPTVLVVEDDEATLELFATALREDYRVFVAKNAEHAMSVGAELGWAADLLVVDLALGEGDRGDQFVAKYRARSGRRTPVIVVSGAPQAYEVAQALRPQSILMKPFELDELVRHVEIFATQPPLEGLAD